MHAVVATLLSEMGKSSGYGHDVSLVDTGIACAGSVWVW
jgi:hypothetical protein